MSINSIGTPPAAERPAETPAPVAAPQRAPAAAVETANAVEKTAAAQAPTLEQVHTAVNNINKSLKSSSQDLEFSVDSDSNRVIVKLVDQKTKEVIRQIPSQEALDLAKSLDQAQGRLIKQIA